MQKTESFFENETHEILWDFKIRTDYQNPDLKIRTSVS